MKAKTFTIKTIIALWILVCSAWLMVPSVSSAQTVIGSWQGTGNGLTSSPDEGWIDWPTLDSITNSALNSSIYSFVSGAVSGYGQSLQISQAGYHQNLGIKLEYLPGGNAAFLTNHLLSFTFSVPAAASSGATAGYSQLYAISFNANGYGFHDQSTNNYTSTGNTTNNLNGWQPNFNFYTGAPARSQTVTLNYSNVLSSIAASNTASSGYIELIFSFNNGGGAPTNYFINNVVLSGGPVTVVTNPPPPPPATNSFTFTLLNGPAGSALNSSNGVFTWRPPVGSAGTTNLVTVVVTENTAPNLSATNSYNVIVNPLETTTISAIAVSGGQASLTVNGTQGPDYTLLTSTNLTGGWQTVLTTNSPVLPLTLAVPVSTTNPVEFYRIQISP
jgi:hypothetical protein